MKVGDLIDLLQTYSNDDEIEIDVYETISGKYVDSSYDITISEEDAVVPALRVDIEAEKFRNFLKQHGILIGFGPRKCPHPRLSNPAASGCPFSPTYP